MNTTSSEAEAARFAAVETAFLGVLKAKVDILNAAQHAEKDLREKLRQMRVTETMLSILKIT